MLASCFVIAYAMDYSVCKTTLLDFKGYTVSHRLPTTHMYSTFITGGGKENNSPFWVKSSTLSVADMITSFSVGPFYTQRQQQ